MTESPAGHRLVHSFVVRVYRFDPGGEGSMAGVIEAVDGSGTSRHFADPHQLVEILCALLANEELAPREPRIARRAP